MYHPLAATYHSPAAVAHNLPAAAVQNPPAGVAHNAPVAAAQQAGSQQQHHNQQLPQQQNQPQQSANQSAQRNQQQPVVASSEAPPAWAHELYGGITELGNIFNQLLHESWDQFDDQHWINEQLHEMTAQAQSLAWQAHQVESIPRFVAGGETVQMGSSSQGWYSDEQRTNDGE